LVPLPRDARLKVVLPGDDCEHWFPLRDNEIVIYFAFFALMLAATEAGFHLGRKSEGSTPEKTKSQVSTVAAGILGVLGLLLGFTMSMAVSRFDHRLLLPKHRPKHKT
jgi:hypothetical protein